MMTSPGLDSGNGSGLRTAAEGIVWPAILPDTGAHLLAVNYQLERSQWWPREAMRRLQLVQLHALLSHAVATVPYYRRSAYRKWLRHSGAGAWAAFRDLPLLARRDAHAAGARLFSAELPAQHGGWAEDETSGSTGIPLRFRTTSVSGFLWNAIVLREHFWHRRDFDARHAFIRTRAGSALEPTWGPPSNQIFVCGESANLPINRSLEEKRAWLSSLDPHYLMTTPSTLRSLAESALAEPLKLQRLKQVRTVGETVTDDLRDLVRRAWGVGLADVYSLSECGMIALQCPLSGHYHVQEEWAVVEVIDEAGLPVPPGGIGRIVVTPLHNFAMPLVRYETGDYAEAGDSCDCGRGLGTLRKVLGRHRNRLVRPDGSALWPNLSSLPWSALAPPIRRFQLRRRTDHSLVLRYEASRPLEPHESSAVTESIFGQIGCALPLNFERVPELPQSKAGKLEDFITEAGASS